MGKASPSPGEVQPQGQKASSERQTHLISHETRSTQKAPTWLPADFHTLIRLKSEGESWDAISKLIPRYSAKQCESKWSNRRQFLMTANAKSPWSKAEIQSLYDLFKEDRDWEAISQRLGRSSVVCRLQLDEYVTGLSGKSQWPWTQNEDRLLAALWQHGIRFDTIWHYFKDRTGPTCFNRWNNHLRFRRDYQAAWSPMEDRYLLSLSPLPKKYVYMPPFSPSTATAYIVLL